MKYVYITIFSFISLYAFAGNDILVVDFDQSMGISNKPQYNLMFRDDDGEKRYEFYKNLYQKNSPDKITPSVIPIIPKIIHHIWVGPKPVPELYLKYAAQCRAIHPEWEYKLWREVDLAKENFDPKYMDLFEKFENRYSGKKDVIESQILYKYGGVVMDMDFQCIKPLDDLHYKYDFYAGLEPGVKWSNVPVMTNAVIGSRPGNKLFLEVLDKGILKFDQIYERENTLVKQYFRKFKALFSSDKKITKVPDNREVLMMSLAKEVFLQPERMGVMIIFPATYFNPVFPDQSKDYSILDKVKIKLGIYSGVNYFDQPRPETIAIQDFND